MDHRDWEGRGTYPEAGAGSGRSQERKLHDPLAHRLLAGVVAVSLAIAAVTTLLELSLSYHRSLEMLRAELDAVQRSVKAPLEQALQAGDTAAVERELARTLQLVPVFHVQVVAGDGRIYEAGRPVQPPRDRLERTVKLEQVQAGGAKVLLGSMRLESSTSSLKSQIFDRFLGRLLLFSLALALLSLFVLHLVRRLLTRHLAVIVAQMRRTTSLNLREPLLLDRPYADDEIGELAQAFNLMRRNMQHEIDIREKHDRAVAAENLVNLRLLDALPQAVLRLTGAATVAWMNARAERLCGLPLRDAQDRRLAELLPAVKDGDGASAEMLFARARSTGQTVAQRIVLAGGDSAIERDATAVPLHDDEGELLGVLLLLEEDGALRTPSLSPVLASPA